ncbi:hypothetical protein ACFFIX_14835 [Metabacillus herbersteinensis]|uniref:Phage protein n=1 Tax=Metabacillus herbersteinensis TaxID=283816 RepID=A0ABV6GHS4_9BACI
MKKITGLEYRVNDKERGYPALYHYDRLNQAEIFCRRLCDYFIKNGIVYHQTSCSLEREMFVIYVEEAPGETVFRDELAYKHVTLEIRMNSENEESKLLKTLELFSHDEVLSLLGNDFLQIEGLEEYEFKKTSAEIDEDRSTYVLYVELTGEKFN